MLATERSAELLDSLNSHLLFSRARRYECRNFLVEAIRVWRASRSSASSTSASGANFIRAAQQVLARLIES